MDKLVQYLKRIYLITKYSRYGWHGNYKEWRIAEQNCGGYNAENILQKVKAATIKVKNGEAVYERDSVLYNKIEYSWPLLANLLWIAGLKGNNLSVIDLGGSLGTTYFQNRFYLNQLKKVTWSVVEQKDFVSAGKKEIADGHLDFFYSADEAIQQKGMPDVLLLSCVLPYIEKPFELLRHLTSKEVPYIIIENTYFNPLPANRLTIQKVPPFYYDASYPAWFLDYNEVIITLQEKYDMIAEYNNEEFLYLNGEKIMYKGFIMQLKK